MAILTAYLFACSITEIYEGTSEIQHLVIANDVIKEYKTAM